MIINARVRAAGALLGVLLATAACGDGPIAPDDRGEDPKQPPPTEAMAQPQAAPLFA